jgi:hypothetical protein
VKRVLLLATFALAACDATITAPPKPPPPLDACEGLAALKAVAVPDTIRVNGASSVTGSGGSGRYTYAVTNDMPVGTISGNRYVAGLMIGTDQITVSDGCTSVVVAIDVTAAFDVQPTRATVAPGTTFTIVASGTRGAPTFLPQGGVLPSGGSISPTGTYAAGTSIGTDVVLVRDSATGDQAAVVITVSTSARFRPAAARLALPAGTFIPLETLDGTGVVDWTVSTPGVGVIEQQASGPVFRALQGAAGQTVDLVATDRLLNDMQHVKVRVLSELTRPSPRGPRSAPLRPGARGRRAPRLAAR